MQVARGFFVHGASLVALLISLHATIAAAELPMEEQDPARCADVLSRSGPSKVCSSNYLCFTSDLEIGHERTAVNTITLADGTTIEQDVSVCQGVTTGQYSVINEDSIVIISPYF